MYMLYNVYPSVYLLHACRLREGSILMPDGGHVFLGVGRQVMSFSGIHMGVMCFLLCFKILNELRVQCQFGVKKSVLLCSALIMNLPLLIDMNDFEMTSPIQYMECVEL